jgi:hypothetical protein
MKLNNQAYDRMNWFVRIFLPAVSALYFGLAQILGLPAAEQVVGSIAVVTVFLGTVLGLSNKNYEGEGQLVAEPGEGGVPKLAVQLDYTLEELLDRDQVVLKIRP